MSRSLVGSLATAEFFHIVILLFSVEEEALEQLSGREGSPLEQGDVFAIFFDDIDDLLLRVDFNALLGIVAELYGLPDDNFACIRGDFAGEQVQEGTLSSAVFTHDTHTFAPLEDIGEVVEDGLLREFLHHVV